MFRLPRRPLALRLPEPQPDPLRKPNALAPGGFPVTLQFLVVHDDLKTCTHSMSISAVFVATDRTATVPRPPLRGYPRQPMEDAAPAVLVSELTPGGRIVVHDSDEPGPELSASARKHILAAFESSPAAGILHLGVTEPATELHESLGWWRDFGRMFVAGVCAALDPLQPERFIAPAPDPEAFDAHAEAVPPMPGAELITPVVLEGLWYGLGDALRARAGSAAGGVSGWLRSESSLWNVVGRVCLHLAENRRDPKRPFAFMATYVHRVTGRAQPAHLPLQRALKEYAGQRNRKKLLAVLAPLSRAAEESEFLGGLLASGRIFQPLAWTAAEAHRFLLETAVYENAGLVIRTPDWWNPKAPPRPQVSVTVGARPPSLLGVDSLLDFDVAITLGGERLTAGELDQLLASSEGLALIRGKWVEVDADRLREVLDGWKNAQQRSAALGIPFGEAMRLLAGVRLGEAADDADGPAAPEWSNVAAGPWLREQLAALRDAAPPAEAAADAGLRAVLRPYQERGVGWLLTLRRLGLGGCLADDMGLGKTIQALAVFCLAAQEGEDGEAAREGEEGPDLLIAPASLLENWRREAARFAPRLRVLIAHPSRIPASRLKTLSAAALRGHDLVVTTYGTVRGTSWMRERRWRSVVLDEAQAVKNPDAKQTRAVKAIPAGWKLALTGTPVENRLTDLWSLFDFLNPGLLGTGKAFQRAAKTMAADRKQGYAPLRRLLRPYILRRLKTDRSIIADLPDKTEVTAFCALSRKQAALYERAVSDLRRALEEEDGMKRRGVVLAFLTRFKQICNHPSQWLGDGGFDPAESGKFARLREIGEAVAARQDKALVFTQFRALLPPLAAFLDRVFGRPGLMLHGGTPVRKRAGIVRRFQEDERTPFLALSLKAGGVGLNLTAASHVIHFDRWWNPAVEDQATDRAYRIGQHRNVLVHKFVCRGTLEERIDAMIAEKRKLAGEVLSGGAETAITELSDDELVGLVELDLARAVEADAD